MHNIVTLCWYKQHAITPSEQWPDLAKAEVNIWRRTSSTISNGHELFTFFTVGICSISENNQLSIVVVNHNR
jgi:hypothetical protein